MPLRNEIEGQRLPVWYWPNHLAELRWWHPPTVLMPEGTHTGAALVRDGLWAVACLAVLTFAFRRLRRRVQAMSPPQPEGERGINWFALALVLGYLGILGLFAYWMSL